MSKGRKIPNKAFVFVMQSKTLVEFEKKYTEAFPNKGEQTTTQYYRRIANLWSHRKGIHESRSHLLLNSNQNICPKKQETIPDVGEILIRIHNQLSELLIIQKERLEIIKKLSGVQFGRAI
jgi:hypothetical protein